MRDSLAVAAAAAADQASAADEERQKVSRSRQKQTGRAVRFRGPSTSAQTGEETAAASQGPTKEEDDASASETEEESFDESVASASAEVDEERQEEKQQQQQQGGRESCMNNRPDYVVKAFEDALSVQRARLGRDHPVVSRTLHSLGIELRVRGRYNESAKRLMEAMDLVGRRRTTSVAEDDELEMAALLSSMGNLCRERGMVRDSAGYYRSSVASLMAAGYDVDHPKVVMMNRIAERHSVRR